MKTVRFSSDATWFVAGCELIDCVLGAFSLRLDEPLAFLVLSVFWKVAYFDEIKVRTGQYEYSTRIPVGSLLDSSIIRLSSMRSG